ncbi:MAG: acyl-CoA/acyl-ACP dehydrogenase [Actinomycetia bacterium]|nr:acyl-CoA/acyl-ACP dehydrogenase [Actinomycetes bacterium]
MSSVDDVLTETATRLFESTCTFEAVQAAEDEGWPGGIWDTVAESGFPWVSVPEEGGGMGGTLADALEIVRIGAEHAAPIPVAETGLLAGWLLAGAGLRLPEGIATVAPPAKGDVFTVASAVQGVNVAGELHRVPWARQADRVVVLAEIEGQGHVLSLNPQVGTIEPGTNMAGEPRDTIRFDSVTVPAEDVAPAAEGVNGETLMLRGALVRATQMAGALEAMNRLTVGYTNDRHQFGRPVGRFQAVQQHLVWSAQDAAMARMAADIAGREAGRGAAPFEIASAKVVANRAARTATAACHQAHGAMGMTQEYALHHLSRRLWSWRHEYGSDQFWRVRLGRTVHAAGADNLFPAITGGSAALGLA